MVCPMNEGDSAIRKMNAQRSTRAHLRLRPQASQRTEAAPPLRSLRFGALTVDAVHGNPAKKFGVEVGGFLRHDFAAGGDFHDLLNVAGVQQERDLRPASVDRLEGGRRFTLVGQVFLGGYGLRSYAQCGFEDALVEQDDVKLTL